MKKGGFFTDERELPTDGPVIFWAQRSSVMIWRAIVLAGLVLGPLAIMAPSVYIIGVLGSAAFAYAGLKSFRFEVTARALGLRVGLLIPRVRVPLADIVDAQALPDAGSWAMAPKEDVGIVMIRLKDGRELPIVGIVNPAEAVSAVTRLAKAAMRHGLSRTA